jgi:phosphoribosylglycinamide formyltransferase-1
MMRIAVMVSGGGTNLQAIIDGINAGKITNTEICLVYSNNPNAYAIERAKKAGIPTAVKSPREFENRADFNAALLQILTDVNPDLIVLAGCLVVIPEAVVEAFPNRIINIHPSLIPAFCGTGFYGLKVHEKVLERGARVSGATVHFVDAGTDTGPIILQKPVMIRDDDTPETLQRRIMEQAEWKIMPMAIDLIANGKVRVENGKAVVDGYDELLATL